jgi:hypothetical protein
MFCRGVVVVVVVVGVGEWAQRRTLGAFCRADVAYTAISGAWSAYRLAYYVR